MVLRRERSPFERAGVESALTQGIDNQSGGRLDRDEQLFGTIAEDGVIIDVVDADNAIVQVALISGGIITGEVFQYTAPVITRGSRVRVLQTQHSFAHVLPLAQYPPNFQARVVRVNGSGEYKTAELRHMLTGLGDGGAITAPALYDLDIADGDIALVATKPIARVAAIQQLGANHMIIGKVRAAAQGGSN